MSEKSKPGFSVFIRKAKDTIGLFWDTSGLSSSRYFYEKKGFGRYELGPRVENDQIRNMASYNVVILSTNTDKDGVEDEILEEYISMFRKLEEEGIFPSSDTQFLINRVKRIGNLPYSPNTISLLEGLARAQLLDSRIRSAAPKREYATVTTQRTG